MAKDRTFTHTLFPPYRLEEAVPFGFWYVGFFGMVDAFFNIAINFFSHFTLLLGYFTETLGRTGITRLPGTLDLSLAAVFSVYYLVSTILLIWFSSAYWNFTPGAKKKLTTLIGIDIAVFCLYNVLYFTGIYLYWNYYLVPKLPLYAAAAAFAVYFLMGDSDEEAKKVVVRRGK